MGYWRIDYWVGDKDSGSLEKWFDRLSVEQFKSVAKEVKMLELFGNELKLPHSRALGAGLFELRERKYGYRIYYCFCGGRVVLLLAAGDKTSQERDVKVARERLLHLKKR